MKTFTFVSLFFVSAATLVLSACGHSSGDRAAEAPPISVAVDATKHHSSDFNYFPADQVATVAAIPAPPAPGSTEDLKQIKAVFARQQTRTDLDCQRANTEVAIGVDDLFGPPYGPLSPADLKRLDPFLNKVLSDTSAVNRVAKKRFSLPRPFAEDSDIHPCVPLDPSSSYPSGHATASRVLAHVLDAIMPSKANVIDERAATIADDRVLAGMHRPSDIQAGQALGDVIFAVLQKQPAFQEDLQNAR